MNGMTSSKHLHRDLWTKIEPSRMQWNLLQHFGTENFVARRLIGDPRSGYEDVRRNRQNAIGEPVCQLHVFRMPAL